MVAITAKLGQFRGESRFTTWAYKFVIFEVSTKLGRHFWRNPTVAMDAEAWDRLPDRFGLDPARASEWRDLMAALHRAVDEVLTLGSGRSSSLSSSTAFPSTPWSRSSARTVTPSTRCFSTPDVSYGPCWSLTAIWTLRRRGPRERLDRT